MRIGAKIALALAGVFAVLFTAGWLILRVAVLPGFERIEATNHAHDVIRLQANLNALARGMRARVSDYSTWDDAYRFVHGRRPTFMGENFSPTWFANYDVDLVAFADDTGKVLSARSVDVAEDAEGRAARAARAAIGAAWSRRLNGEPVSGFVWSVDGPLLFSASAVTDSAGRAAPTGLAILAKRISVEELGQQAHLDIAFVDIDRAEGRVATALEHFAANPRDSVESWMEDRRSRAILALRAPDGRIAGAISVTSPRDLALLGVNSVLWAALFFALACLAALTVVWLLLQHLVIRRLRALERHLAAQESALTPIAGESARDEIGRVSAAYNALIARLRDVLARERDATQARDAEAEANRMKSAFLARIGQELRSPLDVVLGYSELVMEELDHDPALRDDVGKIRTSGRQLLDLLNEILDLSRIEAGRMALAPAAFHPVHMLDDIAEITTKRADEQGGAQLVIDVQNDLGVVFADEARLRQCLLSLIGNASRFTDRGAVTLRARRLRLANGDRLRFDLEDDGLGMTNSQIARLFEPFAPGEAALGRRAGGAGLGLAIAKRLIELMGGSLVAQTRGERGVLFMLETPAVAPDAAASDAYPSMSIA